jgi:hypothetical protein
MLLRLRKCTKETLVYAHMYVMTEIGLDTPPSPLKFVQI